MRHIIIAWCVALYPKKDIARMTIPEIIERAGTLPASSIATTLNAALADHQNAVVTAPPGAGKSTLLPLTLHFGAKTGGKTLMLEPRRLAARQIAERMASLLGEPVGQTVGYRVRFEKKVSKQTRIEVLTEGILARMLIDDPTLEGVDCVVFDEFHERSINSDLALALTRQTQQILRPDLRIVVMSATIDATAICEKLSAPLVESEGRMFPVETVYAQENIRADELVRETVRTVCQAHREHEGDILVFLPGQGEIEKCAAALGDVLLPTRVFPLYGNLSPERQRQAIAPSAEGERKVVLATPVAETSLTIEGVRVVVDTGLCRKLVFDARNGLSHLETVRISRDMATQRRGRAGRVAAGWCYRMWTAAADHLMEDHRQPEILEADLAPTVLGIAAFGESDIMALPWLTPPPAGSVAQATDLLVRLGAIDKKGAITPLGKRMAAMPCHPRIARMMLRCESDAEKALACDIAALLEEKDPLADCGDGDISRRISALRRSRRNESLGRWGRVAQVAREYCRMVRCEEDNRDASSEEAGLLIASAYPERVALAADVVGTYRLSGGGTVRLEQTDTLTSHEWLAVASLHAAGKSGRVFLAAPLCPDDVETETFDRVAWNGKLGCVTMQRERRIGQLVVSSQPLQVTDNDRLVSLICEAAAKDGLSMFSWNEDVQRLQRRIAQVAEWHPELSLPDVSTHHLLATVAEWLPLFLVADGRVATTSAELHKVDLVQAIWSLVPYELQAEVDRLAPTHVEVPTGSRIRIDYRQGASAPVLSVRLQECFGLAETPSVDGGRQPLLMELLSPGYKPVQLTQDLASFWNATYFEVRKELKRRYPKHYWPENPLAAEAVRGVKRRG